MSQQTASSFDSYYTSITSEVDHIKQHIRYRKQLFKTCMTNFKQHLLTQTSQLQTTQLQSQNKNELIKSTYQHIYNSIINDSDIMLRNIRKTYQTKKIFWRETINDTADDTDIEIKRFFHQAKQEAEENYLDAIEERKIKLPSYRKLVALSEKDRTLANYQESNRQLQINVSAGTLTHFSRPNWKEGRDRLFDNKQNSMLQNWETKKQDLLSPKQLQEEVSSDLLNRFMRQ